MSENSSTLFANDEVHNATQEKQRARNANTGIRFTVPLEITGSLIGTKGSVIQQIQDAFNVAVAISDINTTYVGTRDRIGSIQSENMTAVRACFDDIVERILVQWQTKINEGDARPGNPVFAQSTRDGSYTCPIALIVPGKAAGYIIGKGGETIKSISDKNNCVVSLSSYEEPPQNIRRLQIKGTDPSVWRNAFNDVLDTLAGATDNVAWRIDRDFSRLAAQPFGLPFGAPMQMMGGMAYPAGADALVYPNLHMQQQAQLAQAAHSGGAAAAAAAAAASQFALAENIVTEEILVAEDEVGGLIGKQGAIVRDIQQACPPGTTMHISRRDEAPAGGFDSNAQRPPRVVLIKGSLAGVHYIQSLVYAQLDFNRKNAGGRGNVSILRQQMQQRHHHPYGNNRR